MLTRVQLFATPRTAARQAKLQLKRKNKAWKIPSLSVILSYSPLKTSSLVNQNPTVGDSRHWAENCAIWHLPSLSCWGLEHLCPSLHALPRFPLPSALSLRVFPTPGTPGESGPFSPPSPQVSFWDLGSAILLAHPPGWREQTVRNSPPSAHCKLLLELNSRSLFHSFIQYLLGTFCGAGTVLGVGNSMVIMVLALMMLTVKGMKTGNKQGNK